MKFWISLLLMICSTTGTANGDSASPFGNIHPLSFGEVHCGSDLSLYHPFEDDGEGAYVYQVEQPSFKLEQSTRGRSKRGLRWATGQIR